MHTLTRLLVAAGLTTGLTAGVVALTPAPAAHAADAGSCTRWAATQGSDTNPGTQAAPYRSLAKLAASLGPDQVGCLPAGQTYYAIEGNGIIGNGGASADHPARITTGGAGRATVKGQLWFQESAHDLTFSGLDFRGSYGPDGAPTGTKNTMLIVHGDRITFSDNDISNGRGICLGVGKGNGASADGNVLAEDVVITRNRIHGCGADGSITWNTGDSGAHGVYLEYSQDAVVSHNFIYGNLYRGVQLWPRNDGAEIAYNLFDGNATQVNIGSSEACDGYCRAVGFRSENTDVHHNVFSNRNTAWRPNQNPSQVYGYFKVGSPSYGNQVHHNCFAPNDAAATGDGFVASDNTTQAVTYADRAAGNFTITNGACAGMGPDSNPVDPPEPARVSIHDARFVEGNGYGLGEMHVSITRTGDLSQRIDARLDWIDVTATTNGDYNYLPGGRPMLLPGESSATVIFEVMRDEVVEGDETFRVVLSELSSGVLVDGEATGTIVDDDRDIDQPSYRPDAQVRAGNGAWVGDDVVNTTGAGQGVSLRLKRGASATVWVRVQNDGNATDSWSLAEAGPGGAGIARRWFSGTTDVTTAVDGGNHSFRDVASGATRLVKLVVKVGSRTRIGATATWSLHAVHNPVGDGIRDVVKVSVRPGR